MQDTLHIARYHRTSAGLSFPVNLLGRLDEDFSVVTQEEGCEFIPTDR
jgi:hypothetical protein